VKVADTTHESHGHKPPQHVEMFATKFVTLATNPFVSLEWNLVCYYARGKSVTKSALSWTQIMKVADFHNLCPW